MAKYEELMTKYEGPALEQVPPKLKEGEKEIIALFHDECCFHANDYKSRAWLKDGQTILQKKGRGRLIHVSDFITEASGRLIICDPTGKILRDARKVIFPGSNGDPWWDTKQLLEQVDNAITIFEEAHPKCQALFVFDQSSAHASLGPDALKAFEMNKGDGGKQRVQRDTIIPMSNPSIAQRGNIQKMTINGKAKGLEQVLKERGVDTQKFRKAKCAPYWGWCKYRYRQSPKTSFQEAKDHASGYLDACPPEVIQCFIQRSWRFMSAYRIGLTGRLAAWVVRGQKSHRQHKPYIYFEVVLNMVHL
ncbi:hypothetical protein C8J57DRAFT_1439244 [Mycena rebaudengoi]|nr:hypothetical protein C8J57DRAFT_1439244 [Mycena rebaudengoi]